MVEAVRFACCEAELVQAIGRGRGVRRDKHHPLDVYLFTNVPLPLPIDAVVNQHDLAEGVGPIEELARKGVIPLDHAGMAQALDHRFKDARAVIDWLSGHPEVKGRYRDPRVRAERLGEVDLSEFVGFPYKRVLIGNSNIFTAFRYRRAAGGYRKLVLVNVSVHPDPRAAVEAVLREAVSLLEPVHVTARPCVDPKRLA